MKLIIKETAEMGALAAAQATKVINEAIEKQGYARLLLSTRSSQFPFFNEFVKADIDWSKVEMFHLDEYVGISEEHPASFKRYLLDRFVNVVKPGKVHLIEGQRAPEETISELTELVNEKPIDLGMIGIGENGHIAFNDPPADFDDERAYKIVTLNDTCLRQQVREGWFENEDAAFKQAISMTCKQILKCETIISVVPHAVKAEAIKGALTQEVNNMLPATLFKTHNDVTIYCDENSASLCDKETLAHFA